MSRVVAVFAVLFVAQVAAGARVSGEQQPPQSGGGAPQQAAPRALGGNVEHGRYLVEQVAMCGECHSTRGIDGTIAQGTRFKGGPMVVRPSWSTDWPNYFPRIAGLPGYTDEQALRLLTQGAIRRDGTQLRAPMPRFRMSQQDAADVIAFLRSQ